MDVYFYNKIVSLEKSLLQHNIPVIVTNTPEGLNKTSVLIINKILFPFYINWIKREPDGDVTHLLLGLFTVTLWEDEGQFKDPWTGRRSHDPQVWYGMAPAVHVHHPATLQR